MRGADPSAFEQDERHFLYREYLRIIRKFKPAVFVMENVKGLLSSTHGGSLIFDKIFEDLSRPEAELEYDIRSFVRNSGTLKPSDFIIEAERYGLPQRRHRVILFGVRRDGAESDREHRLLVERSQCVTVRDILSGIPKLRSRLSLKSRKPDSVENWLGTLRESPGFLANWKDPRRTEIKEIMHQAIRKAASIEETGDRFVAGDFSAMPMELDSVIRDARLGGGVCQHGK
jgi:DNA (cytosine-5)-methyltransferase 1